MMNLEPLTVRGITDNLSRLMDYVAWAAAAGGLDEAATYRLSLAVDEIATNVVLHGYADYNQEGDLTVWAEGDEAQLRICLEDTGHPFDPRQVPRPDDLDRPLEERRDGGLGIFLALWGVDGFTYHRVGGKNRSVFVMDYPRSGEPNLRTGQ